MVALSLFPKEIYFDSVKLLTRGILSCPPFLMVAWWTAISSSKTHKTPIKLSLAPRRSGIDNRWRVSFRHRLSNFTSIRWPNWMDRKARSGQTKKTPANANRVSFLNVRWTLFHCLPLVALLETRGHNARNGGSKMGRWRWQCGTAILSCANNRFLFFSSIWNNTQVKFLQRSLDNCRKSTQS